MSLNELIKLLRIIEEDSTIVSILKAEGFRVIPGERDSFGWVTGLIITKKGNILFG